MSEPDDHDAEAALATVLALVERVDGLLEEIRAVAARFMKEESERGQPPAH